MSEAARWKEYESIWETITRWHIQRGRLVLGWQDHGGDVVGLRRDYLGFPGLTVAWIGPLVAWWANVPKVVDAGPIDPDEARQLFEEFDKEES